MTAGRIDDEMAMVKPSSSFDGEMSRRLWQDSCVSWYLRDTLNALSRSARQHGCPNTLSLYCCAVRLSTVSCGCAIRLHFEQPSRYHCHPLQGVLIVGGAMLIVGCCDCFDR